MHISSRALAAACGIVLPSMAFALLLASVFSSLGDAHAVHLVLAGVAAAAVGLSLQTGLRAARHAAKGWLRAGILVLTFVSIFFWRLPLLWVVGCMVPLSVGLAWLRLRREDAAVAAERTAP